MVAFDSKALASRLGRGDWPSFVLVTGDDSEAVRRSVETLLEALPEEARDTAVERFDEEGLVAALDAARTRPLLGDRRVVVVDAPSLLSGKTKVKEPEAEALKRYAEHAPEHALLVLIAAKIDRRKALAKSLLEAALVIDCARPKEREMPRWIVAQAAELGLKLPPQAAQAIADAVGIDTGLAARELDKLRLLVGARNAEDRGGDLMSVSAEAVEMALGPSRAVGAFALEDALLAGRGAEAVEALDRHLQGGGSGLPLPLLGRLASIVRRLALARGVVEAGGDESIVRETLGCHPFVAKKYARAARSVGRRADRALAACVEADRALKSGGDARAALIRVVLALAARA